jgi:hypothetical protein
MDLKAGARLKSAVDETEVIVVRTPSADIDLRCGGAPMTDMAADAGPGMVDAAHHEGTLLGKRYVLDDTGLEILCTKAGAGSLSIGDVPMTVKDAKPLPSSD